MRNYGSYRNKRERQVYKYLSGDSDDYDRKTLIRVLKQGVHISKIYVFEDLVNDIELLTTIEDYTISLSSREKTISKECLNFTISKKSIIEFIINNDNLIYVSLRELIDPFSLISLTQENMIDNKFDMVDKYIELLDGGYIIAYGNQELINYAIPKLKNVFVICKCNSFNSKSCEDILNILIDNRISILQCKCSKYDISYEYQPLEDSNDNICYICFDTCNKKMECGHTYHQECIDSWEIVNLKCGYCNNYVTKYMVDKKIRKNSDELRSLISFMILMGYSI
jgi:hypothetical protein